MPFNVLKLQCSPPPNPKHLPTPLHICFLYAVVVYTNNYGNLSKVLCAALRYLYIYYNQIQAIPSNGENDPSESVQQQANESHSPERDPDIQDVNMKDAPRCGQIFQWDQLQPKWTHKCTPSAESDKHIALVDTSEVPLVAKPEECTVTTPDVSTVATPEARVTDSLMEQHQLDMRVCAYICSQYLHVMYTSQYRHSVYNLHIYHVHAAS